MGIAEDLLQEGKADGQPFWLGLIQGLLVASGDVDATLPSLLREGVTTCIFDKVAASGGVWEKATKPSTSDLVDLRTCDCKLSSAEDFPELLDDLISMEVKSGFLVEAWLCFSSP